MDKYIYLILSSSLFGFALLGAFFWPNLRKVVWVTGILGGIAGPFAELWYFRDYWYPPTLRGMGQVSAEDFLFGFGATAVAASYFKANKGSKAEPKPLLFIAFFGVGFAAMILFTSIFSINSIYVSSLSFLTISLLMVIVRRDLLSQAITSSVILTLLVIPIYYLLSIISPGYWNRYLLIENVYQNFGMPATELLWYLSWGSFAGIMYPFVAGKEG